MAVTRAGGGPDVFPAGSTTITYSTAEGMAGGSNGFEAGQKLALGAGTDNSEIVEVASVTGGSPAAVVLDDGVQVMEFAYLVGPLYVGPHSRIIERASVKESVSIGRLCKIGGEVEASVIESHTNKQHHGFLGHAYVGSWVNLGAGTSNSDLKNTYGNPAYWQTARP